MNFIELDRLENIIKWHLHAYDARTFLRTFCYFCNAMFLLYKFPPSSIFPVTTNVVHHIMTNFNNQKVKIPFVFIFNNISVVSAE